MSQFSHIPFKQIRLVVFDVDGTLYPLLKMRLWMAWQLLVYYIFKPKRWSEVLILKRFRNFRKKFQGMEVMRLRDAQFDLLAQEYAYNSNKVEDIVNKWMIDEALPVVMQCRYMSLDRLMMTFREMDIKLAALSDYPCDRKVFAMRLVFDMTLDATHPEVDALKPHPKGLKYMCQQVGVDPAEVLFIGDRPELDGLCAQNAGVHYLGVPKDADPLYIHMNHYLNSLYGPF